MTVSGIPVVVAWKENVKHLYLDVLPPDGRVSVRVPEGIAESSVRLFVIENLARVKKIRGMRVRTRFCGSGPRA